MFIRSKGTVFPKEPSFTKFLRAGCAWLFADIGISAMAVVLVYGLEAIELA
jgi:hypothetical protein